MDQLINMIGIKDKRGSAQSTIPATTYESPKPSYKGEIHLKFPCTLIQLPLYNYIFIF